MDMSSSIETRQTMPPHVFVTAIHKIVISRGLGFSDMAGSINRIAKVRYQWLVKHLTKDGLPYPDQIFHWNENAPRGARWTWRAAEATPST